MNSVAIFRYKLAKFVYWLLSKLLGQWLYRASAYRMRVMLLDIYWARHNLYQSKYEQVLTHANEAQFKPGEASYYRGLYTGFWKALGLMEICLHRICDEDKIYDREINKPFNPMVHRRMCEDSKRFVDRLGKWDISQPHSCYYRLTDPDFTYEEYKKL